MKRARRSKKFMGGVMASLLFVVTLLIEALWQTDLPTEVWVILALGASGSWNAQITTQGVVDARLALRPVQEPRRRGSEHMAPERQDTSWSQSGRRR